MKVTIPRRDRNGFFIGTIVTQINSHCPICTSKRGGPVAKRFCEDGEFYSIHTWENPCGHLDSYDDCLKEAETIRQLNDALYPDDLFPIYEISEVSPKVLTTTVAVIRKGKNNDGSIQRSEDELRRANINLADGETIDQIMKHHFGTSYEGLTILEVKKHPHEHLAPDYMLLGRYLTDCEYFLGAGDGHQKHLSGGIDIPSHIAEMRRLYSMLSKFAAPEWLSSEDIDRYEKEMLKKHLKL